MSIRLTPARAAAALGALALLAAPFWLPPLLRGADAFAVRRVEIAGARLLAPHEVLAAAGVRPGQNVWDDPAAWRAALAAHPVVEHAEVRRRLPGTLQIRIAEKQPVALVEVPVLRAATAAGELLPVDPAGGAIDLPLLRLAVAASDSARDALALPLLAELGRLNQLEPDVVGRASEVRLERPGVLRLTLSRPRADVLLPIGADAARLNELMVLLRELERRAPDERAGRAGRLWIDLRFADQIVLRRPNSV